MMNSTIAFIGGGNMAGSLVGGLISNGYPRELITVTDPDADKLHSLQQQYGVHTTTDNNRVIDTSKILVLAIKPQIMQDVCRAIADHIQTTKPLIISIAAGIRSNDIDRWLGGDCAIVRCMPNTPALLQVGATGLFANSHVVDEQRHLADAILATAGINVWVENESLLDAVTAVSGSGPAYFFLLMEAMQNAAQQLGLDADMARQLTLQTALGAARMATESTETPEILRTRVTSKGGTTEAAINCFQQNGFETLVAKALSAACHRASELAEILGKDT
ncbi:MAG: pyrroline-5-carboxylate reductase [Gammaproteobacteria bacterium]|nr:MAG: pyrroline-5-carboxylate reductase [Gammaproteobacteria bacterium]